MSSLSDLIGNQYTFECFICCNDIPPRHGVKLRNCSHLTCLSCLKQHVVSGFTIPVTCSECETKLDDRDVRGGLNATELKQYETMMLDYACGKIGMMDYCHQTNCSYRCQLKNRVKTWECPSCRSKNCVACKAIHPGQNCRQYTTNIQAQGDVQDIERKICNGELRRCPQCSITIRKVQGCTFYRCTNCRTPLCWDHNSRYRQGNCFCSYEHVFPNDPLREELRKKDEPATNNDSGCLIS